VRVSDKTKKGIAIGAGVLAVAGGAFFLLKDRAEDIPVLSAVIPDDPATCPLTGIEPKREELIDRPAVAVKVENAPIAYPLSGLEDAEVVYEELVEGGSTRFLSIYHCTDSAKVGPVRSARAVDPAIISPITHILAYSGQNDIVLAALEDAGIVRLDEDSANGGLVRIPREGLTLEHTLYADTPVLRRLGNKEFDESPPEDLFAFGDLEGKTRPATSVEITFSGASIVRYEWDGDRWLRYQGDTAFMTEGGDQVAVDNVLIQEHDVNLSDTIFDSVGNPSTEIGNETGSGRAVLFRDGRAIVGTWSRESIDDPVVFETKAGDDMVFAEGSIWVHLVPSKAGEVQGSFDYAK
jgi:hypothetical protein